MKFIALTIILMLTAGIAGYTVGNVKNKNLSLPRLTQTPTTQTETQNNSLFDAQTANVTGSITSISDKTLTIKSIKGQEAKFMASDKLLVIDLGKPAPASPAAALQSIQQNKIALIQLQMEDGQYKVISINYLPAAPPKP